MPIFFFLNLNGQFLSYFQNNFFKQMEITQALKYTNLMAKRAKILDRLSWTSCKSTSLTVYTNGLKNLARTQPNPTGCIYVQTRLFILGRDQAEKQRYKFH